MADKSDGTGIDAVAGMELQLNLSMSSLARHGVGDGIRPAM